MTYSIKVHDDFKTDLEKLSKPIKDQLYKKLKKDIEMERRINLSLKEFISKYSIPPSLVQ